MANEPKLKADWTLEHIGNIGVDSGDILLIDPVHQNRRVAVTSPTSGGDGIFPVYQIFEGKALVGLFVAFEVDPPAEGDGQVSLGNLEEET